MHWARNLPNPDPETYRWDISINGGIFQIEDIKTNLLKAFKAKDDDESQPVKGKAASYVFSLSPDFIAKSETLGISTALWATRRLIETKSDLDFTVFSEMVENLRTRFSDASNEKPLNADLLKELDTLILQGSDSAPLWESGLMRGVAVRRKLKSEVEDQSGTDLLNSFYIQDLGRVLEGLQKGNTPDLLQRYMLPETTPSPGGRYDIRKELDVMYRELLPERMPDACWPAKGNHPLVFSQQFAVNSIINRLGNSSGIYAVNGPPGTGKTTMLRDLIAHVVTERAKVLADARSPQKFFSSSVRKAWYSAEYDSAQTYYHVDEALLGYEIVVASSNNGAVENVTKEIPSLESMAPDRAAAIDFFKSFGDALLSSGAWGSGAAALGNGRNKNAFVQTTFFGTTKKNDYIDYVGLINELKEASGRDQEAVVAEWNKRRKRFQAALADVTRLKALKQAIVQNVRNKERQVEDARRELETIGRTIVSTTDKLKQSETALHECQVQRERAHLLLDTATKDRTLALREAESCKKKVDEHSEVIRRHRQHRLGIVEIIMDVLFNRRKRFQAWQQKMHALEMQRADLEEDLQRANTDFDGKGYLLEEATTGLHERTAELTHANAVVKGYMVRLAEHREHHTTQKRTLQVAIEEHANAVATIHQHEQRSSDDQEREKSSPWMDKELQAARSILFIEALNLHSAFIRLNAKSIIRNLWVFRDVLQNKAPIKEEYLDAVRSAWATLFLCVPVVSTTFASFSRLFPHFWNREIGWLLIDEAGQAQPQAAVGALMRSKRVVAVGDPLQLEPIIGLPLSIQQILRERFQAPDSALTQISSVQKRADHTEPFGTYLDGLHDECIWVGSPLRVHRRCESPMFEISNKTTYNGMMVQGKKTSDSPLPPSKWVDVPSGSGNSGHWIPAEGDMTVTIIDYLLNKQSVKQKDIYVISPFRDVVKGLNNILERYKDIQRGTVHTVQGKEAEVVILVLGTAQDAEGARSWAASKPNLLNVSVTRSRTRLYVLGSKELWKKQWLFNQAITLLDANAL